MRKVDALRDAGGRALAVPGEPPNTPAASIAVAVRRKNFLLSMVNLQNRVTIAGAGLRIH